MGVSVEFFQIGDLLKLSDMAMQSVLRIGVGKWDWMNGGNALLTRELRVALRSPRAWMLIALYISMLGALVLAQFPFDEALTVPNLSGVNIGGGGETAAQRGHDLLIGFVLAQAFLVWLLVPSLACGALAQERERQTLEPLLLSPLSPLQIVWGKAAGVLATASLLLLGTLPLTSLCFLLGGVSPGEVAAYYALLLTLAFLFTGIGLYCAATWTNALRATIAAYAFSLLAVPLVVALSGPGSIVAGLYVLGQGITRASAWLRRITAARHSGAKSWALYWVAVAATVWVLWQAFVWSGSGTVWLVLYGLFIAPYGYFLSRFILQNAAQAVARRLDPTPPRREQVQHWQKTWHETMSMQGPIAPTSTFPVANSSAPSQASASTSNAWTPLEATPMPREVVPDSGTAGRASARQQEDKSKATYGVKAFLPDNRNPIFARDLRHGLGGRAQTFFRAGYLIVIATELLLIFYLMLGGGASPFEEQQRFAAWSRLQLVLVMLACAWLGSRAIAPEREGQTLPQLLTIPMTSASIIGGKIASVLFFSAYVMLLGLPLTFIMPMLGLVPWSSSIAFLLIEIGFALLCAAWGLNCSLWCSGVRHALGCALGGVATMLLGGPLLLNTLDTVYRGGTGSAQTWKAARVWFENSSPMHLITRGMTPKSRNFFSANNSDLDALISVVPAVLVVLLIACGLIIWGARSFSRTAQTL